MPHATEDTLVNGDAKVPSKSLSHLTSYPIVSDAVETFKSHPVGKKSIEIADGVYTKYGKPVEPYLETPYSYAKPYVTKADELAASGLGRVDATFPIMKEDTGVIVDYGKSWAYWPFQLADDGKGYVLATYNDEYKKTVNHKDRAAGLQTTLFALISTLLKIASDFFQTVADALGPKYEESKKKGADYVSAAKSTAEQYKQAGQGKVQEYTKLGEEKADEVKKEGKGAVEQTKQEAGKAKEEAKKTTQQK